MTVIAARVTQTELQMASDSLVSDNSDESFIKMSMSKITEFDSPGMLVGVAGSLRMLNLIRDYKPPVQKRGVSSIDYMMKVFQPHLVKFLTKHQAMPVVNGERTEVESIFLIAFDNHLWRVYPGMSCFPLKGTVAAIGSGWQYAIGALEAGATVEMAVNVAKTYDSYCGGDVWSAYYARK